MELTRVDFAELEARLMMRGAGRQRLERQIFNSPFKFESFDFQQPIHYGGRLIDKIIQGVRGERFESDGTNVENIDKPDTDFHTARAAEFFKIPVEQVTTAQRELAKGYYFAENYGVSNAQD